MQVQPCIPTSSLAPGACRTLRTQWQAQRKLDTPCEALPNIIAFVAAFAYLDACFSFHLHVLQSNLRHFFPLHSLSGTPLDQAARYRLHKPRDPPRWQPVTYAQLLLQLLLQTLRRATQWPLSWPLSLFTAVVAVAGHYPTRCHLLHPKSLSLVTIHCSHSTLVNKRSSR